MVELSPSLAHLIGGLRHIVRDKDDAGYIENALSAPVRAAALSKDWVENRRFECDLDQGFGVHLLHGEADHSLAVLAVAWLPGRAAPIHDHGTWAIVAGVEGAERNRHWRRTEDGRRGGFAALLETGEVIVGPGQVLTMLPAAIHSVTNDTEG